MRVAEVAFRLVARHTEVAMNRVAGLLLVGLVVLLGVTLTQSPHQAFGAAICPADGETPTEPCDASGNCFHHCCLTSGLCPSASCMDSLDSATDDGTQCSNKCLDAVACRPFNPACVPHNNQEHCIGTVVCKTAACDGRQAGAICLFTGVGQNFRICQTGD